MREQIIALFGEAEKGPYDTPILCSTLSDLHFYLGQPPPESQGLFYAIQALHYSHQLLFIRVREEGFSTNDYMEGVKILGHKEKNPPLTAICAPGVGDSKLITSLFEVCTLYQGFLITTQKDLFDYFLTFSK